jgi:hypothetical protein
MFNFLFKKRYKLDEPLTLLDRNYLEIYDRICNKEPYWISEDGGGYLEYYHNKDADSTKEFSGIFDVRVHNFVEYVDNEKYDNTIFAAGKIYSDKDESFIDKILHNVIKYKQIVRTSKGHQVEDWYWYNDKIQIKVEKEYDNNPNHEYWRGIITYRLLEPTPSKWYIKSQKEKKKKKTGRDRIEEDIKKCLK